MPNVGSRVEQPDDLASLGIQTGQVRPFVFVAAQTRPGEIVGHRRAAVLFGDDVVQLKPQFGPPLGKLAILAAESGPSPDVFPEPGSHVRHSVNQASPPQRRPRFRLEELQRAADRQTVVQFLFLIRRQPAPERRVS